MVVGVVVVVAAVVVGKLLCGVYNKQQNNRSYYDRWDSDILPLEQHRQYNSSSFSCEHKKRG